MTTTNTPMVDEGLRQAVARAIELAVIRHGVPEHDLEGTTHDADAILALLASRDVGGAVGWMYELAEARVWENGEPVGWTNWGDPRFSVHKPCVPEGSIRNLRPLYAAPDHPAVEQPSIPAGMVAYGPDHPDYPNAPRDWDRGAVVGESGDIYPAGDPIEWKHEAEVDAIVGYRPKPSEQLADTLFAAIEHGDAEHRIWLKRAIEDHFAGRPVERPRGKGASEEDVEISEEDVERAARGLAEHFHDRFGFVIEGDEPIASALWGGNLFSVNMRNAARAALTAALGKGDRT